MSLPVPVCALVDFQRAHLQALVPNITYDFGDGM